MLFFSVYSDHRDLHSFPTRRSSDLIAGASYRLLYLEGRLIDAVRRDPPTVTGDGYSTIRRLIAHENRRRLERRPFTALDRKSTRLNSSHSQISYAVFCLKKKKRDRK